MAYNDDYEDKGTPLLTHHADSRILAALPARGPIRCAWPTPSARAAGLHLPPAHPPPRPDFEFRVVALEHHRRAGRLRAPITVHALRREGFNEDILLSLDGAPPGFALNGAWVPGGQDKVRLTLTVPPTPTKSPVSLQLVGSSRGRGPKLTRAATPAEEMMQAFLWQHLVPAKDWTVFVAASGRPRPQAQLRFDYSQPVR